MFPRERNIRDSSPAARRGPSIAAQRMAPPIARPGGWRRGGGCASASGHDKLHRPSGDASHLATRCRRSCATTSSAARWTASPR